MRRRRLGRFGAAGRGGADAAAGATGTDAADATGAGTDAAVSGIASPRSRMTSSRRSIIRPAWAFSGSIDQGPSREVQRRALIAPLEGHPGKPDERDRVGRVVGERLRVDLLGLVQQPQGEGVLGAQQLLDHAGSPPDVG